MAYVLQVTSFASDPFPRTRKLGFATLARDMDRIGIPVETVGAVPEPPCLLSLLRSTPLSTNCHLLQVDLEVETIKDASKHLKTLQQRFKVRPPGVGPMGVDS
jgi:hypothetical protein